MINEKVSEILLLRNQQIDEIRQNGKNWGKFLDCAARMYKRSFANQTLIYAQKPNATTCVELEAWNSQGYWINGGTPGIALLNYDARTKETHAKWVFDASDTRDKNHNPYSAPSIWNPLTNEQKQYISNALQDKYAVDGGEKSGEETFEKQLETIAKKLTEEYNSKQDIVYPSIIYSVFSRCGISSKNEYMSAFDGIERLTAKEVREAGAEINRASREILTAIEGAIKQQIIEKQFGRGVEDDDENQIYADRGRADTELGSPVEIHQTIEQIRNDTPELHERTQNSPIPDNDGEQNIGRPPDGLGGRGPRESEADSRATQGKRRTDGEHENIGPKLGMDTESDDVPRTSRGNSFERDDLRLTTAPRPSLFRKTTEPFIGKNIIRQTQQFSFDFGAEPTQTQEPQQNKIPISESERKQSEPLSDALYKQYSRYLKVKESYPNDVVFMRVIKGEGLFRLYGEDADFISKNIGKIDGAFALSKTIALRNGVNIEFSGDIGADINLYVDKIRKDLNRNVILASVDGEIENRFPRIGQTQTLDLNQDVAPNVTTKQENSTTPNFRITDDKLGVGGAKTKYGFNITAIRTLKQIETENRSATPEEQQALSKYVGWGGLPQTFDKNKADWNREYEELKSLLTDDEYEAARASTLNAHYTSPTVIKAIYKTIGNLGFTGGEILEPAMGVGNFFGLLPDNIKNSKLTGVELDSVTGRIAKFLYPNANVKVQGYQDLKGYDNHFDVAIGNIPFGSYKVPDTQYDKHGFLIHDYFFAKALDQVRPGGVVAFITSKGTMDKQNESIRTYIGRRAELLGAIRLPNNAFTANAGTEVTADILFFQKREREEHSPENIQDWLYTSHNENNIPMNNYFVQNPEMILGKMVFDSLYGKDSDTACVPFDGADLTAQLEEAISHIQGKIPERKLGYEKAEPTGELLADEYPDVRNFSYTVIQNQLYYRQDEKLALPEDLTREQIDRAKRLVKVRDCARELIECQIEGSENEVVKAKQGELNNLYDNFYSTYGIINSRQNAKVFDNDPSYYLLCGFEDIDKDGKLIGKADIFTKRTINARVVVTSVDTPIEALAVSLTEEGRVDLAYMSGLLSEMPEDKIANELTGIIFKNPYSKKYETADEYLSGNIREKLAIAEHSMQKDSSLQANVEALKEVMPKELTAAEIDVRLGATWINSAIVKEFTYQLLDTANYYRDSTINIGYEPITATWTVTGKSRDNYNVKANTTYGTSRANAYSIIEDTLNLKDSRVYDNVADGEGKIRRVLNQKETALAQQKQEEIKQAFKDWIFKDPERRELLVQKYNEKFNSSRAREYDGAHLSFHGANSEIALKPHQLNAIARVMYGGNTLLAHEVGAGKTFEMVAAAMEGKRLGLHHKSLFVVPNHLTKQTATEFLRLYPSANILVATKDMFEKNNRKKFCARIATGDYDAIIIGHSQFEKIPMSKERRKKFIETEIDQIIDGIDRLKAEKGERFTIKDLERKKRNLEGRLAKLSDTKRKDDVIDFEELGIDKLFIDEAHSYKNLMTVTKMRNVAGISQSEAQKSEDLLMKCRYMDEITDRKGIVFATGTPISNSMTELYTMMRYLQHGTLINKDLQNFDSWASTFGETITAIELAPEGTGYRARTRFAKFYNLPELMGMFKEVADIKTADMLDLQIPDVKFQTIVAKPTEEQKKLIDRLAERAAKVHDRKVKPEEDNMLVITSDGRKIGLDQRLIDPLLPDDENSKVNVCMRNIHEIWEKTNPDKLTQLVFCDFSTPGKDKFNVYDDIKKKLIDKGIPEEEIAFIHDANTDIKKDRLFEQVRKGEVRVLFGSTFKLGSGTNVQDKLIAMHDLDCPWRPSDLEQRRGRIVRQGNKNPEVEIFRYVTEDSFDGYLYQTIENKQKFISQIMTSKTPLRSCEDADEAVLSYAEIKALCSGNPLIREKMDLDVDVSKLTLLKGSYMNTRYTLEDKLVKWLPAKIRESEESIAALEKDIAQAEMTKTEEFSSMKVAGMTYKEKVEAGAAIIEECKKSRVAMGSKDLGEYREFQMSVSFNFHSNKHELTLHSAAKHTIELSESPIGNITRIENALNDGIGTKVQERQRYLESCHKQVEDIKTELQKPFEREQELREKSTRLNALNIELSLDKRENEIIGGEEESQEKENLEFTAEIDIDGNRVKESLVPTEPVSHSEIQSCEIAETPKPEHEMDTPSKFVEEHIVVIPVAEKPSRGIGR